VADSIAIGAVANQRDVTKSHYRVIAFLVVIAAWSCGARTIRVGVAFENTWRVGNDTLTDQEQLIVRQRALQTLRQAFGGFGVAVTDGRDADRLVIVDTGFVAGLGPAGQPAPVGETFPFARASSVHLDETFRTLMAVTGCSAMIGCPARTRAELVDALGVGIGSTAAHELGHQVGLRFAVDSRCADCYDSHTSNTYQHFFGTKHWSDQAMTIMRRVLPP
jgi:hypothetical protein